MSDKVEKEFWFREGNGVKQAFSYSKAGMAKTFADKWGGKVVSFINVSPDIAEAIGDDGELWSVISRDIPTEKQPQSLANDRRRFEVLVLEPNGFTQYGERHEFIKQANDVAKNIAKFYKQVLVVKRFNRGEDTAEDYGGVSI